jgi:hypothetical protein
MTEVKVGILIPRFDPDLKDQMGYATTASAVTLALDRVKKEQLLPTVNFTSVSQSVYQSHPVSDLW